MELTVKQENLSKAFNIVKDAASSTTSLPILSNILLRTNGSRLLIAATDLEIAVSQNIGAKIEKVGEITVPAKTIADLISKLPREKSIHLKADGEHLLIESGEYKAKINGVAADEFPEFPVVDRKIAKKITLPSEILKNAISQASFAASSDTSRPILTGIFWHSFEGNLYLAATDGYRLSEKKIGEIDEELSAIVPKTSLDKVKKAVVDHLSSADEIEILFDEDQAEFHIDDVVIVSRLIDGKFVDYRRLIPASTETTVLISKKDLKQMVKVASLFARESGGSIILNADSETSKFTIRTIASEFGENTSGADAKITGSGEVTLNPNYLEKAIDELGDDGEISFGFSGKLAPTMIKSTADDSFVHIIMPLKS